MVPCNDHQQLILHVYLYLHRARGRGKEKVVGRESLWLLKEIRMLQVTLVNSLLSNHLTYLLAVEVYTYMY